MSFTDGKPWVATELDCRPGRWGSRFRCYLCGKHFTPGDTVRWQYGLNRGFDYKCKTYGVCNFLVCASCDGPDVLDRWIAMNKEYKEMRDGRWWHFLENDD